MESTSIPVRPVQPPAPYLGGKRNLAGRLTKLIDADRHETYVDVFHCMGGVFLRRTARPRAEAINDISGNVANPFRVIQEHYPYLMDVLRWRLTSRSEFDRRLARPPERLTHPHRAARFLYVQRLAFGGKVSSRNFGVGHERPAVST
jgi:DNA adenine methylase